MTREEAIEVLKQQVRILKSSFSVHINLDDALPVAIKALEQEPSIASASEWCRQNGYVMMPEAVYEQDIAKAYFEGQNIEPCDDCYSRKSVIDVLTRNRVHFCDMFRIISELKELPPVTPKQKIGHWIITYPHGKDNPIYECPCCHASNDSVFKNFCPNCGAKMAESEDKK